MHESILQILEFFGLVVADTSAMTLGDALVYIVGYVPFALVFIYLFYSFLYGLIKFFMGGARL